MDELLPCLTVVRVYSVANLSEEIEDFLKLSIGCFFLKKEVIKFVPLEGDTKLT